MRSYQCPECGKHNRKTVWIIEQNGKKFAHCICANCSYEWVE